MRKYGMALLMGLILLCFGALPASAADAVIYDEGGFLSDSEYADCLAALQDAADYTNMNFGVVLAKNKRSDYAIEETTKQTYLELFGADSDGLVYYMDLSGTAPYDYIATRGLGQFYYTNSDTNNRVDDIFDDLTPYLYPVGGEDVYGAMMELSLSLKYYYDRGVPDHYYVYDDEEELYYHLSGGEIEKTWYRPYINWEDVILGTMLGTGAGLVAALIAYCVTKSRYKFKTALEPTAYVNRKNVIYHEQQDNFVRTYTTRVKIESSSGGGGGRRSGGGRSSGGFGGGGRHR